MAGGNDNTELAPLVIRKATGGASLPGMTAYLEVDDASKIRIFDSRAAGATEIIGPTAGARFDFPDLGFDEKEFGMEATQYADGSFDGLVEITFAVQGAPHNYNEVGVVRVALGRDEQVQVVDHEQRQEEGRLHPHDRSVVGDPPQDG